MPVDLDQGVAVASFALELSLQLKRHAPVALDDDACFGL
jgi:hypothetical protein